MLLSLIVWLNSLVWLIVFWLVLVFSVSIILWGVDGLIFFIICIIFFNFFIKLFLFCKCLVVLVINILILWVFVDCKVLNSIDVLFDFVGCVIIGILLCFF